MALDISDAFKIQYESEFSHALQNMGSKLRDTVWVRSGVQGSQVRFPILASATSEKNRARHSFLSGDGDAHSNVTATLNNYESHRFIDSLDEFKADADYRSGYTQSVISKLGTDLDTEILTAMNSSHTSAGAAAAMSDDLIAAIREIAGENYWPTNQEWYWVVTPAVFSEVLLLNQTISGDYSQHGMYADGGKTRSVNAFGFVFIESQVLDAFKASSTSHNTYVYSKQMVGLGIGRDITPKVNYSVDRNSTLILAEMSAGAVTIQTSGVYEVEVNGL